LENEKLKTLSPAEHARLERLVQDDRVALSPHIGGWSFESLDRINDRIVEGIAAFLAGELKA
jgi:D-3-phosphoglycerate dehydrogenase / 2-oxoglutarate reductase